MFLSKIIKVGEVSVLPVSEFSFCTFEQEEISLPDLAAADDFQPMFAKAKEPLPSPPPPVFEPAPEPQIPENMVTEEELAEQVQQAHAQAYAQGVEEGAARSREEFASACASAAAAARELLNLREKVLRESEDDLLRLSVAIAEKVIRREIGLDRRIVENIVVEALGTVSQREQLVVRLNPADHALLKTCSSEQLADLFSERKVTLLPDEEVTPSGCMVETEMGMVDARIESQLEEIANRLFDARLAGGETASESRDEQQLS